MFDLKWIHTLVKFSVFYLPNCSTINNSICFNHHCINNAYYSNIIALCILLPYLIGKINGLINDSQTKQMQLNNKSNMLYWQNEVIKLNQLLYYYFETYKAIYFCSDAIAIII
jgi:hypothetical protein